MIRRVWETTRRTREKIGTKLVVELRKIWPEMEIKVEGKDSWGSKYAPTNMPRAEKVTEKDKRRGIGATREQDSEEEWKKKGRR